MNRDTVRAMVRALPDTKEDGASLLIDPAWEVTLQAGGNGAVFSVQLLTRVTLEDTFLVVETQKGRRVVLALSEVRGFVAEPSAAADGKSGRRPGFM